MSTEEELRSAIDELARAYREGDVEAMERLNAPEYVQTDIWGRRQDLETWMTEYFRPLANLIRAGRFRWETYDQQDLDIRIYDDAAVVTGRLVLRGVGARPVGGTWKADPVARISGILRFSRFWVRRHGRWHIAALHNASEPPRLDDAAQSPAKSESGASSSEILLRRVCEEAWAQGNLAVIDEVWAPSVLVHDVRSGDGRSDPEREKRLVQRWRAAFPDFAFVVDFVFGGGDMAMVRWTMAGTYLEPLGEEPPTGKRFEIKGANIWRFENGKVVEIWNHRDDLGFVQQLGLSHWPGAKR